MVAIQIDFLTRFLSSVIIPSKLLVSWLVNQSVGQSISWSVNQAAKQLVQKSIEQDFS